MTIEHRHRGRGTQSPPVKSYPPGLSTKPEQKLLGQYEAARRARDRWVLGRNSQVRCASDYALALKHLAKQVASETTESIDHRQTRAAVRAAVYAQLTTLFAAMEADRVNASQRARRTGQWMLAASSLFLVVLAAWIAFDRPL